MNHDHAHCGHDHAVTETASAEVKDPICGMTVDPARTEHHFRYGDTEYHFCSSRCREKFAAEPERYLNAPSDDPALMRPGLGALAEPAQGTIWTCPMHPEIRRSEPGSCPICGMALEPLEPSLEEGPNPELVDMTRRFWLSALFSIPLVILTLGADVFGWHLLPMRLAPWAQLALATPVVLWGGWPFFERGWASVRTRNLNMFTLISLGVGVAYLYSLVATVAPQLFPPSFRTMGGAVPVSFEAAAVITTLVLLGQVLELRARSATACGCGPANASRSTAWSSTAAAASTNRW